MPSLEEYLGGLVRSLAQARQISDLHTARAAEFYAEHQLLKDFSVPRMRFSSVELTVPVAIASLPDASIRNAVMKDEAIIAVIRTVARSLGRQVATKGMTATLRPLVLERLQVVGGSEDIGEASRAIAHDVQSLLRNGELTVAGRRTFDGVKLQRQLVQTLREHEPLTEETQSSWTAIEVVGESHKLRDERPSDLVFLKIEVSEEGLEWTRYETSDGQPKRRLLPE